MFGFWSLGFRADGLGCSGEYAGTLGYKPPPPEPPSLQDPISYSPFNTVLCDKGTLFLGLGLLLYRGTLNQEKGKGYQGPQAWVILFQQLRALLGWVWDLLWVVLEITWRFMVLNNPVTTYF